MGALETLEATTQNSLYTPFTMPTFSGKHRASDTYAWLTRQQYQDYLDRFVPRENALIDMTTYANPALMDEVLSKGTAAAGSSYDTAVRQQDQFMGRYGAAISADQLRARDRSTNLGRAAAIVDAANRIRQSVMDTDRSIVLGMSNAAASTMSDQGG